MNIFPICLNLQGADCLVVGAGEVAAHKIDSLLNAGAQVRVVAPEAGERVQGWQESAQVQWLARRFEKTDLDGMTLVIAATADAEVNRSVAEAARARQLPVNVVDSPALCSFIMPSVIRRGPLHIALSSSGNTPVLLRQLKARLEGFLPERLGDLTAWAGRWRQAVKDRLPDVQTRRRFWESLFESPLADQVMIGRAAHADAQMHDLLDKADVQRLQQGRVALVGAGPGDPELLTLKALRHMQNADVVLYDALVSDAVLEKVRKEAERIFVGKQCRRHAMPQADINQLILQLAQQGKRVVRLKGGDPFVFGRGAEELDLLITHAVSFEVIPGITSAQGAACYGGLPLTHRDFAHGVSFITGHGKNDLAAQDWQTLAASSHTLVFYMGLGNAAAIRDALCAHGRAGHTPAAIVSRATQIDQRIVHCTLQELPDAVTEQAIATPALILIGSAPRSEARYQWFGEAAEQYSPAQQKSEPDKNQRDAENLRENLRESSAIPAMADA